MGFASQLKKKIEAQQDLKAGMVKRERVIENLEADIEALEAKIGVELRAQRLDQQAYHQKAEELRGLQLRIGEPGTA